MESNGHRQMGPGTPDRCHNKPIMSGNPFSKEGLTWPVKYFHPVVFHWNQKSFAYFGIQWCYMHQMYYWCNIAMNWFLQALGLVSQECSSRMRKLFMVPKSLSWLLPTWSRHFCHKNHACLQERLFLLIQLDAAAWACQAMYLSIFIHSVCM